jgi:hypothetical protein
MNRNKTLLLTLLLGSFAMAACSGKPGGALCPPAGCVVAGNANVSLTLLDAPPTNTAFINFNLPVSLISLTPQSGADVNLLSAAATYEITRLQSDSTIIGTFQVPAGTYTSLNFFVTGNTPTSVWVNASNAAINGCNPLEVCHLAGTAQGKISVDLTKAIGGQGLVVASGQNIGLGVEFNLNNAITAVNGISIDLTQPNVFTVLTLPRAGQAANTLDTIDAFLGIVQTVSGSNITLKSDAGVTLTAAAGSSTTFNAPPGGSTACGGNFNLACIAVGQTLSVDATVGLDGTLALTNVDFLDLPAADEIEGTLFTTTTLNTYLLVVSDKTLVSGNAILTPVGSATTMNFTIDPAATFAVETSDLPVSNPTGFAGTGDILNGQTVLAHVKPNSASQGALITFVADRLILRPTRMSGTVGTVTGNDLSIQSLPTYLGFVGSAQARTFLPQTIFDNVTGGAINNLSNGDSISIRALFLNPATAQPPLLVEKLRKH